MTTRRHISETTWAKSHIPADTPESTMNAVGPATSRFPRGRKTTDFGEAPGGYYPGRVMSDEAPGAAAYTHSGPVTGREISSPDHQGQTQAFGRLITPNHQYADGVEVPNAPLEPAEMSDEPQGASAYYQGTKPARRRVQGTDSFE